MRITKSPDVLQKAGLPVIVLPGWAGRDNGYEFPYIRGATIHHTAGSPTSTVDGELNVLVNGRTGLPGPISQFMVGRNGVWYCVADGCCNHNKVGWAGPNAGFGNRHLIGIECQHSGAGEVWTPVQYSALVAGTAALSRYYRFPVDLIGGHKEHQPGEKVDPSFSMTVFRSNVARHLREGKDMALSYESDGPVISKALHDTVIGRSGVTVAQVLDELRTVPERVEALETQLKTLAAGGVTEEMHERVMRRILGGVDEQS